MHAGAAEGYRDQVQACLEGSESVPSFLLYKYIIARCCGCGEIQSPVSLSLSLSLSD
jgi:hypothetical protein